MSAGTLNLDNPPAHWWVEAWGHHAVPLDEVRAVQAERDRLAAKLEVYERDEADNSDALEAEVRQLRERDGAFTRAKAELVEENERLAKELESVRVERDRMSTTLDRVRELRARWEGWLSSDAREKLSLPDAVRDLAAAMTRPHR